MVKGPNPNYSTGHREVSRKRAQNRLEAAPKDRERLEKSKAKTPKKKESKSKAINRAPRVLEKAKKQKVCNESG